MTGEFENAAYCKRSLSTSEYIEKLKLDIKKNEVRLLAGAGKPAEIRAQIENAKFKLAMLSAPTLRAGVVNGEFVEYR